MIVKCPSCEARFRLDREKLAGKRVTLRCVRCRNHFKVALPRTTSGDCENLKTHVMVAHTDPELCSMIREIVEQAGMIVSTGNVGEEVLRAMVVSPPHVAVVDVALEGLFAFEVVEKVRRQPGLSNVKIILLSSVYKKMAYKRSPISLYGADDYIEKHHIPDDLVPKINKLLVSATSTRDTLATGEPEAPTQPLSSGEGAQTSHSLIDSVNQKIRAAEQREVAGADLPERERAQRLARIIVSDIALYYQDRVDEGIRGGNWSELLAREIKEARTLFRDRFPSAEIQQGKLLETAFLDLFERRRRELEV